MEAANDPFARDASGHTALYHAAHDPAQLRLLLDALAPRNPDDVDRGALVRAASEGDPECIRLLANAGADVNRATHDGITPLAWAAMASDDDPRRIEALRGAGAHFWSETQEFDPLAMAAESNNVRCLDALLAAGARLDPREDGAEALRVAASYGYVSIVDRLLREGVSCNTTTRVRSTPLHAACHGGHAACVRLLLEADADVWTVDELHGRNCVHWATVPADAECLTMLLGRGVPSFDVPDMQGRTPLLLAVHNSMAAHVRALLSHGAERMAVDCGGAGALHLVQYHHRAPGTSQCVGALLEAGVDCNMCVRGETALMAAARWDNAECIALLAEARADVNLVCKGSCALSVAMRCKSVHATAALLDAGARFDVRLCARHSHNACVLVALHSMTTIDVATAMHILRELTDDDDAASVIIAVGALTYATRLALAPLEGSRDVHASMERARRADARWEERFYAPGAPGMEEARDRFERLGAGGGAAGHGTTA